MRVTWGIVVVRRASEARASAAWVGCSAPPTHVSAPPTHVLPPAVCRVSLPRPPPQDQYVSVEELLLAMADDPRFGAELFQQQGLGRDKLEEVIQEVRGGKT